MAMTRIKYGVEYDARTREEHNPSGAGWIVVAVILIAAVSFAIRVVSRMSTPTGPEQASVAAGPVAAPLAPTPVPPAPPAATTGTGPADAAAADDARDSHAEVPTVEPTDELRPLVVQDLKGRPPKAKSLLFRLDEAARKGDLAMQVSTIEQLRALPGDAVADIDDTLVGTLGELNMRWLYELKNPQWVTEVTVKRGDSATRIAQEHGSTLGSLKRLNPGADVDRLQIGSTLKVMNHPSLTLIVRKKLRTVDLLLNGKLFKRYTLPEDAAEIKMEPGGYRTPANLREYFRREGIGLAPQDAAEIDQIVPRDTPVRVSAS